MHAQPVADTHVHLNVRMTTNATAPRAAAITAQMDCAERQEVTILNHRAKMYAGTLAIWIPGVNKILMGFVRIACLTNAWPTKIPGADVKETMAARVKITGASTAIAFNRSVGQLVATMAIARLLLIVALTVFPTNAQVPPETEIFLPIQALVSVILMA
mmetsp:Transcript_4165/g.6172  ORF Transcript_4165/g.6172 Transcript_4165/m.6172 type:complete len:159 (-) Transcript_4165:558-1034(-)